MAPSQNFEYNKIKLGYAPDYAQLNNKWYVKTVYFVPSVHKMILNIVSSKG